jgi:hypothetical protein
MARRFYLPSAGSAALTPTANAAWSHVNAVYRPMSVTKGGTASADHAYSPDGSDHLVAGDAVNVTFVSTEVLAAQTITAQTVKLAIQARETHAGNNLALAWEVYVVAPNGSVRGAIVSKRTAGAELPTAITGRFASVQGASVVAQAGDRLVLRVGYSGTPVGAGGVQGHNGTVRLMDVSAQGDLPESDGSTSAILNPWLEFANDLTWNEAPPVTGTLSATLGALAIAAAATVGLSGAATPTLSAATGTASGVVSVAGATSSTLNAATATSTGALALSGSASPALGAASLTSAGTVRVGGATSASLGAASATGAGSAAVSGGVVSTLAPATVDAAGNVGDSAVNGSLSAELGPVSASATGTLSITGGGASTLGACEALGSGTSAIVGDTSATLSACSLSATGSVGDAQPEPVADEPPDTRTAAVSAESRAALVPADHRTVDAMSAMTAKNKGPYDSLDYTLEWSDWLGEDAIASVTWLAPDGITSSDPSNTATSATIWLSGGTEGKDYDVTCRVTTTAGRVVDRTLRIRVEQQ